MAAHGACLSRMDEAMIEPPVDMASITAFISTLFEKLDGMHAAGVVHGGTLFPDRSFETTDE